MLDLNMNRLDVTGIGALLSPNGPKTHSISIQTRRRYIRGRQA